MVPIWSLEEAKRIVDGDSLFGSLLPSAIALAQSGGSDVVDPFHVFCSVFQQADSPTVRPIAAVVDHAAIAKSVARAVNWDNAPNAPIVGVHRFGQLYFSTWCDATSLGLRNPTEVHVVLYLLSRWDNLVFSAVRNLGWSPRSIRKALIDSVAPRSVERWMAWYDGINRAYAESWRFARGAPANET